jgi:hypothetical protein
LLQDIQAGKAALKKVDAATLKQQRADRAAAAKENTVQARLREGLQARLAAFAFDDTASSSAQGGDTTGDFSEQ